ncbi:hypothetical protein GQ54DRAFT_320841 [Martensiomyces pterosporus]|nr:hypothetical protein GQ54DRAFT_320841 [Martensiomyces pterosporus]
MRLSLASTRQLHTERHMYVCIAFGQPVPFEQQWDLTGRLPVPASLDSGVQCAAMNSRLYRGLVQHGRDAGQCVQNRILALQLPGGKGGAPVLAGLAGAGGDCAEAHAGPTSVHPRTEAGGEWIKVPADGRDENICQRLGGISVHHPADHRVPALGTAAAADRAGQYREPSDEIPEAHISSARNDAELAFPPQQRGKYASAVSSDGGVQCGADNPAVQWLWELCFCRCHS